MVEVSAYQQGLAKVAKRLPSPLTGNILITGATGLIGGCLTDLLMQHSECQVYALGRNRQRAGQRFQKYKNNSRFHFLEHDICTPLTCDTDFQYIIHAASNASPSFFQECRRNTLCYLL